MDLSIQDIALLVEELRAYHAIYSPLFQRREQRQAAHTSLQELLATVPRKSIEPMVLALDGAAPKAGRAMQSFISAGPWTLRYGSPLPTFHCPSYPFQALPCSP